MCRGLLNKNIAKKFDEPRYSTCAEISMPLPYLRLVNVNMKISSAWVPPTLNKCELAIIDDDLY